ncbi:T-complex protein 1 subunit gamma [Verticillium alfalfae VaMs.102]|uniref:T-complex protein 1 subunit gamma n=1 Tax=Verticillium alfalfae (strain VaMs.102 / ATCC MYA-4576 / FGSC 10136) TaxID=526221 RepID=C9SE32_VERA1|nr:T-complex protein 1 subunit gamma [Verticillium alfalfae VaMs.102]EEY17279.1 T-complex protein 1 subunit gamma [Verticillium alfalfae VaMs.102]
MQAPVVVMNTNSGERQTGRKAQMSNIAAAKTVADIIRSCLGPKAMLKMLLDPMGGIVLTNDGHAILREIEVSHPAAKSMIELSRTQDEEVGDGTTTVIILAGEMLAQSLPQLERNIHPVQIIAAFKRALKDALEIVEEISTPIDTTDDKAMYSLISSSIGTKFVSRWSDLMCELALKAVRTVTWEPGNGNKEVDIKRYARIEKVPGGEIEDSRVLDGVMVNKDITHPKMRRRIENPRIVLLDCPLEYKKGESQTNIEISKEEDWNRILQIEEEQVKAMCDSILALKPDLVITEKGVSDLAQHYLVKANVTPCGDKEFGSTLADRAHAGNAHGSDPDERVQWGDLAPTRERRCQPVRVLTDLRAKHAEGKTSWGINGDEGVIVDMHQYGVWEPQAIKLQSIKTAIESACLLLRVDDICSARKGAQPGQGGGGEE